MERPRRVDIAFVKEQVAARLKLFEGVDRPTGRPLCQLEEELLEKADAASNNEAYAAIGPKAGSLLERVIVAARLAIDLHLIVTHRNFVVSSPEAKPLAVHICTRQVWYPASYYVIVTEPDRAPELFDMGLTRAQFFGMEHEKGSHPVIVVSVANRLYSCVPCSHSQPCNGEEAHQIQRHWGNDREPNYAQCEFGFDANWKVLCTTRDKRPRPQIDPSDHQEILKCLNRIAGRRQQLGSVSSEVPQ
jgi:hypothetical protein